MKSQTSRKRLIPSYGDVFFTLNKSKGKVVCIFALHKTKRKVVGKEQHRRARVWWFASICGRRRGVSWIWWRREATDGLFVERNILVVYIHDWDWTFRKDGSQHDHFDHLNRETLSDELDLYNKIRTAFPEMGWELFRKKAFLFPWSLPWLFEWFGKRNCKEVFWDTTCYRVHENSVVQLWQWLPSQTLEKCPCKFWSRTAP